MYVLVWGWSVLLSSITTSHPIHHNTSPPLMYHLSLQPMCFCFWPWLFSFVIKDSFNDRCFDHNGNDWYFMKLRKCLKFRSLNFEEGKTKPRTTVRKHLFFEALCKSLSWPLSPKDDKLSENIWFVWSLTSYSGDKWRCYLVGQPIEDSATQLWEGLPSQKFTKY